MQFYLHCHGHLNLKLYWDAFGQRICPAGVCIIAEGGEKAFHVNIKHDVLCTVVTQNKIWAVFCSRTAMWTPYLSPVMVMEIVSFHSCSVRMWKKALNVA